LSKYSSEERIRIYEAALCKYGPKSQMQVAIEEMAELTKELCKVFRTKKGTAPEKEGLIDEISDVAIMLEQLQFIFSLNGMIEERMDFKIERLAKRLGL